MTRILSSSRNLWLFAAIVLALGMDGCAPRKMMVNEMVRLMDQGTPVFDQEPDLEMLAHAMPAHIKLLEAIQAGDPHNTRLLVLMARLYGGYAFAILETQWIAQRLDQPAVIATASADDLLQARIKRYFEKGMDSALAALGNRYPQIRQSLGKPDEAQSLLNTMTLQDVPALFWYGFNLGAFIQHSLDSVESMAMAHLVEKSMQRVVELNPHYYHGSAHLVLMVYYAGRPPMMGGSLRLAEKHYLSHRRIIPRMMKLRELYWARYSLVQKQARQDFVKILKTVTGTPEEKHEVGLLDAVAAARAKIYLKAADRFFD